MADGQAALVNQDFNDPDTASLEPEVVTRSGADLPHDKKRRVQITFGLIGIATLMPWSIFVTATDYWMYKFRDVNASHTGVPHTNKTEMQTFFISYMSIASNVPFLLMLIMNSLLAKRMDQHVRTLVGVVAISLIFFVTTVFVDVDTDAFQITFFRMTLASVVVMSCFSAIFQGSFVATASMFPSRNMHYYATGQSAAGLFAVFAQILSLSGQLEPKTSALYYFLSADIFLIVSLVVFLSLPKYEYFNYWAHNQPSYAPGDQVQEHDSIESGGPSTWEAFKAVKWHAFTVMSVNCMSISVFPPLTVLVVPQHPNLSLWSGRFFIPITNFLMFGISDFVGRWISGHVPLPSDRPKLLFLLSMSRWICVPLLMLCNAHPRQYLPVLFASDAFFVFMVTIVGISNGYLYINAMMNGPVLVAPSMRNKAGYVLVLFMGIGVALGSLTSNVILRLL